MELLRRPVGFDFHMGSTPIKVDAVHPASYAAQLGIKPGWKLRYIDGELMHGKDFKEKYASLMQAVATLPHVPAASQL